MADRRARPDSEEQRGSHVGNDLFRVVTCGSAGSGKSTLIARLLGHTNANHSDRIAARGVGLDASYRLFATARRRFAVTDAPGPEQHTRELFAGASAADCAVVVTDARTGVCQQTRHDFYLTWLLGIRSVVTAVNKMDLVAYSPAIFARIEAEYRDFARRLGPTQIACVPLSARIGDNVCTRSPAMPWYGGPSVLEHLESVPVAGVPAAGPLRLLVEIARNGDRGRPSCEGLIISGTIAPGDPVRVLPSGRQGCVARLLVGAQDVDIARAPQSVTVTLEDAIEVNGGDVLAAIAQPPLIADEFEASVVWMHEQPMLPGRSYVIKLAGQTAPATIAPLKHKVHVDTLERVAARTLELDEIGVCGLALGRPVVFEPYGASRALGGFTVIDPVTGATVGAGLLHFALRRSQNVHWQVLDITKAARAALTGQRPCVVWFTGLSGAGKSTIANLLEKRLHALGRPTYLLDGDNVRHGLNKDLGFTAADRVENIRRVAEVSRLMVDAGLIVLVSFISPFRAERRMARDLVEAGEFCEVFVDAPLAVAEARDPKGLYGKARRGELKNFTGIDSPYEPPEHPELRIDTARIMPEQAVEMILERLCRDGIVVADGS